MSSAVCKNTEFHLMREHMQPAVECFMGSQPAAARWVSYSINRSRVTEAFFYLTIRPVARKGNGAIAHEAKPNGLLPRGP